MEKERIDLALKRLDEVLGRAERAAGALDAAPAIDPAEHAGLQERHSKLKLTVAQSLRQLDDILAGIAP